MPVLSRHLKNTSLSLLRQRSQGKYMNKRTDFVSGCPCQLFEHIVNVCTDLYSSSCRHFLRACRNRQKLKTHHLQWDHDYLRVSAARALLAEDQECHCGMLLFAYKSNRTRRLCHRHNSISHFYVCASVDTCCRTERWSMTTMWWACLSWSPQMAVKVAIA